MEDVPSVDHLRPGFQPHAHIRLRSGAGQYLEVPLFGAALTAFSGKLMRVHNQPEAEPRVKARYARCSDGRWFMYFPKTVNAALLEVQALRLEAAGWRALIARGFTVRFDWNEDK